MRCARPSEPHQLTVRPSVVAFAARLELKDLTQRGDATRGEELAGSDEPYELPVARTLPTQAGGGRTLGESEQGAMEQGAMEQGARARTLGESEQARAGLDQPTAPAFEPLCGYGDKGRPPQERRSERARLEVRRHAAQLHQPGDGGGEAPAPRTVHALLCQ